MTKIKKPSDIQVSKEQLVSDLKNIGVSEDDHIGVALSFKSIGHVEGGPETFINALLEVVGPNGTIMMPSFTRHSHFKNHGW